MYRKLFISFLALTFPPAGFADSLFAQHATNQGIRLIAEWEPAIGTMIAWPLKIPDELIQALAADDQLFVLVQPTHVEEARDYIKKLEITEDRVSYIQCPVESEWPRDWGPHQTFDANGKLRFVDHKFDGYPWYPRTGGKPQLTFRTGEGDDKVTTEIAKSLKFPVEEIPVFLTGGNFLVDGHGTAFCTQALFDENKSAIDEGPLRLLLKARLGIDRVIVLENTETVGIQHIDCWLKVLDAERLLVKRAPPGHTETEALERNVKLLSRLNNAFGRKYEILRIDCPAVPVDKMGRVDQPIAAYTNSLILNDKVFVPLFGIAGDKQALTTWRTVLPGYKIKGFPWDKWLDFDALHCRTRAIFNSKMLRIEHPRLPNQIPFSPHGHPVVVTIEDMSQSGLNTDGCEVRFRSEGESVWRNVPLLPLHYENKFVGVLPSFPIGRDVQYYVVASSKTGAKLSRPVVAPNSVYHFRVVED